MGKRQIGELQPSELVVAIMISDLATIPMSDGGIPLFYGVIPIITLVCAEISLSFLCLKSQKVRTVVTGRPTYIINQGKIDQKEMMKARYNLSDLLEELRMLNIFDISEVYSAILETNGKISVLTKETAKNKAYVIICDGIVQKYTLDLSPFTMSDIKSFIGNDDIENVFILSVSEKGKVFCVKKEH